MSMSVDSKKALYSNILNEFLSYNSGVKMGRIPKLVKERALLEQKQQQINQEALLIENNKRSDEVRALESSCSSLSDRSIENYDPNAMETGEKI